MRTTTIDPLAEKFYDISPYAWCSSNPANRIDPNGMADYWAYDKKDGLKYLGNDGVEDEGLKIAQLSNKDARSMKKTITNIRKGKSTSDDMKKVTDGFIDIEVQSENDQNSVIQDLRSFQKVTGNEYGAIITLSIGKDKATLSLQGKIEGNSENIQFRLYGSHGNLRDNQIDGNVVIGTVHTHNHDRGPSGWQMDDVSGSGDMYSAQLTGIPWYTIGPKNIHVATPGNQNATGSLIKPKTNILIDALMRTK
jgi:hypothetical protein